MKTLASFLMIGSLLFSMIAWADQHHGVAKAEKTAWATQEQDDVVEVQMAESTEEPTVEETEETEDEITALRIQHGDEASKEIAPNPMSLLQTLKDDVAAMIEKNPGKPLDFKTKVDFIGGQENIPPLTFHTKVDAEGEGTSKFAVSAVKDPGMDWQGLNGELTFNKAFKKMGGAMQISAMQVRDDDAEMHLQAINLRTEVDEYLVPSLFFLDFPKMTLHDNEQDFEFANFKVDVNAVKSASGVALPKGFARVGKLDMDNRTENINMNVEGLSFDIDGDENDKKAVSFLLKTKVEKLAFLDKETKMTFDINYSSDFAIRNLDAVTLIQMQDAQRDIQTQYRKGEISEEQMQKEILTQMMNIAPGLLVQSPEVAINNLNINTQDGSVNGNINVSIDGSSPISLENPLMLLGAIQAKADVVADKSLLTKFFAMQMQHEMMGNKESAAMSQEEKDAMVKQAEAMANQQIDMFVAQKFLVADGEKMKANMEFKQGQLILNGEPMPLSF